MAAVARAGAWLLVLAAALSAAGGATDDEKYREAFRLMARGNAQHWSYLREEALQHEAYLEQRLLEAENPRERITALKLLVSPDLADDPTIDTGRAYGYAKRAIFDEDDRVVWWGLFFLKKTDPSLVARDEEKDLLVARLLVLAEGRNRNIALLVLGAVGGESVIGHLKVLERPVQEDRSRFGLRARARAGDEEARAELREALRRAKTPSERTLGVRDCAEAGDAKAIPLMVALLWYDEPVHISPDAYVPTVAETAHVSLLRLAHDLGLEPPDLPYNPYRRHYRPVWNRWLIQHRARIERGVGSE